MLLKAIGVLTVVLISSGNKRCEPVHSVCRFQHLGISILRSRHYLVFMHVHNECNDWVKIPISQCTHVKLGYLTLDSQKGLHLQELGLLPNFIIEHIVRARMRHNSSAQRPGSFASLSMGCFQAHCHASLYLTNIVLRTSADAVTLTQCKIKCTARSSFRICSAANSIMPLCSLIHMTGEACQAYKCI